jgi:ribulose-phosphate 3-epimerase
MEIIPSILTSDPKETREMLSKCEGVVERVSIDIIDGKFADNKTITPDLLAEVETNLKIDYQLMVEEPVNWIERCVSGQADRIIGHIEHMMDQVQFVGKVQDVGAYIGLAIDLDTPISDVDKEILTNLDTVLLMSVPAGFGGQKFRKEVISKIRQLRKVRDKDETPFKIHVDGGITSDNIKDVVNFGADEVSVGRGLFKGDLEENIRVFRRGSRL